MAIQNDRGGFPTLQVQDTYDDGTEITVGANPLTGLTISIGDEIFDNFSDDFIEGLLVVARKAHEYRIIGGGL